ncbi:hypothetical protein [Kribbella soli]|nr:hypothetical protein [Kribbella soli]
MSPDTVQVKSSRLATPRAMCSGRTTYSVEVAVAARSLLGRELPAS